MDVLLHHSVPQQQVYAADHLGRSHTGERFEAEEMAEQIEVRSDSNECFTQVDKEGDVKDTIWIEMAEANAVVSEELVQEGMSRNTESLNKIRLEHNKLIDVRGRECLTYCRAPSNGHLVQEDAFNHHSF